MVSTKDIFILIYQTSDSFWLTFLLQQSTQFMYKRFTRAANENVENTSYCLNMFDTSNQF